MIRPSCDPSRRNLSAMTLEQSGPITPLSRGSTAERFSLYRHMSTMLDDSDDAFMCHLRASHSPPVVDLSRTLARQLVAYPLPNTVFAFMCRQFHVFAMAMRLGIAIFVALLFLPKSIERDILSVIMPFLTVSVMTTILLLSADILALLSHNYEFWFVTVINVLNWSVLAAIINDIRSLGCFMAWFSYQSVIMIDANHRTHATALSSAVISIPVLIAVSVFVAIECIKDANYFSVRLHDRKVFNASDVITFTMSTLVLFLIKIFIGKRRSSRQIVPGLTNIPCTTLKLTLRLVPAREVPPNDHAGAVDNRMTTSKLQPLSMSRRALECVDLRRTLLPYRLWRDPPQWIKRNARFLRVTFYVIGLFAYASLTFGTLHRLYVIWNQSKQGFDTSKFDLFGHHISPQEILMLVSCVATTCFCGGFMLFYQKDLLRSVLSSFDFVFSVIQAITFHICVCDANYWASELVVICILWEIWFVWSLTLDALTPLVKYRIFRFKKQFAAPVHASIILATAVTGVFVLLIPTLGFRDRVIWSYTFPNGSTFIIRTLALLLGRSCTIVLWCSRQAYLLFARRDNELIFIRGNVEYMTPFPLITSRFQRASTRVVFPTSSLLPQAQMATIPKTTPIVQA